MTENGITPNRLLRLFCPKDGEMDNSTRICYTWFVAKICGRIIGMVTIMTGVPWPWGRLWEMPFALPGF